MAISLDELATQFACELIGDGSVEVHGVASLLNADSGSLSFLSSPAFKEQLAATEAAAVILRAADADDCPTACLISDNPYASYARIAAALIPPPAIEPGVHQLAYVDPTATVAASAQISANVSIGERSTIGENCFVAPGCVVGPDCVIGDNVRLLANVSIVRSVVIGARCIIHPGTVIGCDGFGNAMSAEGWVKVPQLGGVRIGDDVEIGANCTIDCGAIDDTILENGVRLDNLVHIAHNCAVGAHTAIAAQSGIAGSTTVGKRCMFSGQTGLAGHLTVCDDVILFGKGMITKNIKTPGTYASNFPSEPAGEWNKLVARVRRLGSLIERVKKLEKGDQ